MGNTHTAAACLRALGRRTLIACLHVLEDFGIQTLKHLRPVAADLLWSFDNVSFVSLCIQAYIDIAATSAAQQQTFLQSHAQQDSVHDSIVIAEFGTAALDKTHILVYLHCC